MEDMIYSFNAWNTESSEMLYNIQERDDFKKILHSFKYEILPHTQFVDSNDDDIYLGDIVSLWGLMCKVDLCLGTFVLKRIDGNDFDKDWLKEHTTDGEWKGFLCEDKLPLLSISLNDMSGESTWCIDVEKEGNIYEDTLLVDSIRRNSVWQGY